MSPRSRTTLAFFFGLLILLPLAWTVVRSGRVATSAKLMDLIQRAEVAELLANSIYLATFSTVLALVLGAPLAFLINLRRFPGRRAIGILYFLPLVIPPHIHAIAWMRVIGDQGWLTSWLRDRFDYELVVRNPLGEPGSDLVLGHLYPGPAWLIACAYFPLVTLSISAGLRSLDGEGIEAARMLGGARRALRSIIVPQVAPRICAGALFVFVLALSTFPVVSLLDTPVLVQKVVITFRDVDATAGAAMGLPLVLVAGIAVFLLARAENVERLRGGGGAPLEPAPAGLGTTLLALLPLAIAVGIPLASLIAEAGPIRLGGAEQDDNYRHVFGRVKDAFADSLLTTGLGVIALLVASYPLGRLVARQRRFGLDAVALSTLALPPVVVGVAMRLFWPDGPAGDASGYGPPVAFFVVVSVLLAALSLGRPSATALRELPVQALLLLAGFSLLSFLGVSRWIGGEGLALIPLVLLARFLPFTVRLLRNGFLALDPEAEAAGRLTGHGPLVRWWRLELPRMAGVLAGAAVMAYVLCFTELAATLMVIPPGLQTVQGRIFNMVHWRSIGEVAALCVMVIVLAALPVIIAAIMTRKRWEVL